MTGRFKKSVVMALVAAMCFTQNTGMIRAAEAPEKIEGGVEAETPGYAEPETGSVSKSDIGSDIESEIISDNKVENNSKENRTEESPEPVGEGEEPAVGTADPSYEAVKNSVTINEVSLTPEAYSAWIAATYTGGTPVENYQRMVMLYAEGDREVISSDGIVSRNSLNKDGVNSGWIRLGCGNYNTGSDSFLRRVAGRVIEKDDETALSLGLKPNTTYSYYITLERTNVEGGIYIITDKKTFTTEAGINQTSVTKQSMSVGKTPDRIDANVKVNNPHIEEIKGFYFAEKGKTEISDEDINPYYLARYYHDPGQDPGQEIYHVTGPKEDDLIIKNHLYAVVFAGTGVEEPVTKLVDMGPVTEGISDNNISVTYTADLATIKAVISYTCGEDTPAPDGLAIRISANEAGSNRYNTYYNYEEDDVPVKGLNWEKTDEGYKAELKISRFGDDDDDFVVWTEPSTTYGLSTYVGYMDYGKEDPFVSIASLPEKTVTTGAEVNIPVSEFYDGFLDFIGVKAVGSNVPQSRLDRIRTIYENARPLTGIKGVKYLRNLEEIELNNSQIADISEISQCQNLTYAEFLENYLTTLPDLSSMKLKHLNLDWNRMPESEIVAEKLPKTLEYSYWDDEGEEYVEVTTEQIAEEMKECQHSQVDFDSRLLYGDAKPDSISFNMTVKDHKLKGFNLDKYGNNPEKWKLAFYIFKAFSEGTEEPKEGDSVAKVGIYEGRNEELAEDVKNKYDLDKIYFKDPDGEDFAFDVAKVAGIDTLGAHDVTWRLYKRNIWKEKIKGGNPNETKTFSSDNLIWEDTVTALYGNGIVAGLLVSPKKLDLTLNGTSKLTATVTTVPESLDKSVTWTTGDEKVATVDTQGNVTAVGLGTTTITAASKLDPTKKDTCSVTVKEAPPVKPVDPTGLLITTTDGKDTTFVGSKLTLKAEFLPTGATADAAKVKYETKDTKIVSLNGAELTGLAEGTAVINGSYTVSEGSVLSAQFTVKVRRSGEEKKTFYKVTFLSENTLIHTESVLEGQPALEPEIKPEQPDHMFIGWGMDDSAFDFTTPVYSDLTLKAIFRKNKVEVTENSGSGMDAQPDTDLKKEGNKVTGDIYLVKGQTYTAEDAGKGWSSDNTSVARVAKNTGKITADGEGDAKVSNETHELNVHVAAPVLAVSKVAGKASSVDPKKVSLLVGESAEYKLDKITKNAEKYPVTWYSSNTQVAVVTGGVVTAIGKGIANISAFTGGKEYKGKVTVTDSIKAPDKIGTEAEIDINAMKAIQLKFTGFKPNGSTWEAVGDSKKLEVVNSDRKGNPVLWRNDIIEITNKVKVTGIGEGSTKIKGTDTKGETVTVTVNVKVINTKTAAFVNKDKTATLKFPNVNNKKAEWLSSDPSKVSVDNDRTRGKIRGLAVGSSSVTCSVNNANGIVFETLVYCQEPQLKADPAGKLKIDAKGKGLKGSLSLDAGEVYRIEISGISGMPDFKSGNKTAVFVDENGLIYARQKGKKSTISAKINGTILKIVVTVNR